MQYICMSTKILFTAVPQYSPDCQSASVLTRMFCTRIHSTSLLQVKRHKQSVSLSCHQKWF